MKGTPPSPDRPEKLRKQASELHDGHTIPTTLVTRRLGCRIFMTIGTSQGCTLLAHLHAHVPADHRKVDETELLVYATRKLTFSRLIAKSMELSC